MHHASARNVLVSTTSELEGWEVTSYQGVLSTHVVAGTGLFSDVAASFSDVFGGRSTSYKRQLEKINEEAVEELKEEAAQQGANALVGLRIDHDQISGQGKGMLMVTAVGTAVRAKRLSNPSKANGQQDSSGPVSARDLEIELRKDQLLEEHERGKLKLGEDIWQFVIENRLADFATPIRSMLERLLGRDFRSKDFRGDGANLAIERGQDYFLSISAEAAKEKLYRMLCHKKRRVMSWALEVLKDGRMLDFQWVHGLLDQSDFLPRKRALEALARVEKPYYTAEDIGKLEEIRRRVATEFEKRGEVFEVDKSGMFSSGTKQVWQIEGGSHVPMEKEYCPESGLNIYGFARKETKPEEAIQALDRKMKALKRHFGRVEEVGG